MRRLLSTAAAITFILTAADPAAAANRRFCDTYQAGKETVLLLIDRTSAGRPDQFRTEVTKARDAVLGRMSGDPLQPERMTLANGLLEPGQHLEVSTLSGSVSARKVLFNDCRPGRASGWGKMLERPLDPATVSRHDRDFAAEVTAAIDKEMTRPASTKDSALIDTLSRVTRDYPAESIKKVVIASDMLENVLVTLLPKKGKPQALTEDELKDALRIVAIKDGHSSLRGAEVIVFGFGVDDRDRSALDPQAERTIERFWRSYFQQSGAAFRPKP
jgi:hypothetical protein